MKHFPVDRCMTMSMMKGFLCNCGRTILSPELKHHFDKSFDELEEELRARRESAKVQ